MYSLEEIKSTQLSKKLGGPPVFHDGKISRIVFEDRSIILSIEILSDRNPRLEKNTLVSLKLKNVERFTLASGNVKDGQLTIHDLDIRREDDGLHMRLETIEGEISDILFETIELYEK